MELDDLKRTWTKVPSTGSDRQSAEEFQRKLQPVIKSGSSLKRSFYIELIAAFIIYLSFLFVIVFFGSEVKSFIYKLAGITFFGTLPIYYRLYLSIRWLNRIDYGRDIKSNLFEFLIFYKTTIQVYRFGSYLVVLTLAVVFITDTSFLSQPLWLKSLILVYLGLMLLSISPLLTRFYGNRVKSFESFLQE